MISPEEQSQLQAQAQKSHEEDEEASKRLEEKFSFPKFLEKWKLPEALPLNLLVKRFIKEFTSKQMTAAKQSQAVQEFLGVSFLLPFLNGQMGRGITSLNVGCTSSWKISCLKIQFGRIPQLRSWTMPLRGSKKLS